MSNYVKGILWFDLLILTGIAGFALTVFVHPAFLLLMLAAYFTLAHLAVRPDHKWPWKYTNKEDHYATSNW